MIESLALLVSLVAGGAGAGARRAALHEARGRLGLSQDEGPQGTLERVRRAAQMYHDPVFAFMAERLVSDLCVPTLEDDDVEEYHRRGKSALVLNPYTRYWGTGYVLHPGVQNTWDSLVPWIVREFHRLYAESVKMRGRPWPLPDSDDPDTIRNNGQLYSAVVNDVYLPDFRHERNPQYTIAKIPGNKERLRQILDWFDAEHPDIMRFTYAQALAESQKWHQGFAGTLEFRGRAVPGVPVAHWEDGARIDRLVTRAQVESEGFSMGHCVGGRYPAVRDGQTLIFSYRDPQGRPQCTFEVSQGGIIQDLEGIENRPVSDPKAPDRVRRFANIVGIGGLGEHQHKLGAFVFPVPFFPLEVLEKHGYHVSARMYEKKYQIHTVWADGGVHYNWFHVGKAVVQMRRCQLELAHLQAEARSWSAEKADRILDDFEAEIIEQARSEAGIIGQMGQGCWSLDRNDWPHGSYDVWVMGPSGEDVRVFMSLEERLRPDGSLVRRAGFLPPNLDGVHNLDPRAGYESTHSMLDALLGAGAVHVQGMERKGAPPDPVGTWKSNPEFALLPDVREFLQAAKDEGVEVGPDVRRLLARKP